MIGIHTGKYPEYCFNSSILFKPIIDKLIEFYKPKEFIKIIKQEKKETGFGFLNQMFKRDNDNEEISSNSEREKKSDNDNNFKENINSNKEENDDENDYFYKLFPKNQLINITHLVRKDNYDKESCKEDSEDNNSYNENELEFESIKEGDYELNEKSNKHKDLFH